MGFARKQRGNVHHHHLKWMQRKRKKGMEGSNLPVWPCRVERAQLLSQALEEVDPLSQLQKGACKAACSQTYVLIKYY